MQGNFLLWLAWALFGTFLAWLLWRRYLPLVLAAPPIVKELTPAPSAWLYCEDGAPLDRRVQWFPLRQGGHTVIGARPRSSTPETEYVYLTADDIQEDHARIRFEPDAGRYRVEPMSQGPVLHNNDPLPAGTAAELSDGDTLDLGRLTRFRFTLTGPEEP